MDVCLLSNPPNSGSDAALHLYRLSGGSSSTASTSTLTSGLTAARSNESSAKVWSETVKDRPVTVPPAAVPAAAAAAAIDNRKGKGRAKQIAAQQQQVPADAYIQPRAPESTAWSPDGQLLAYASTTHNLKLYSVHDGKPAVNEVDLPSSSNSSSSGDGSLYLLSWEECLPPGRRRKRESIMAEELEMSLPRLPELKKEEDAKPKKASIFANPFLPGFAKPYVPAVPFVLPSFPSVPPISPFSPNYPEQQAIDDYSETSLHDAEGTELRRLAESPTLLMAGDEKGNLHFLLDGSISLGSVCLGNNTEFISALVSETSTKLLTALSRNQQHTLALSLLISVPLASASSSNLPPLIRSALPPLPSSSSSRPSSSSAAQETQIVLRLLLDLPQFPSPELTLLARAATSIKTLLYHAFEALDDARKSWEEARDLGAKWLDRLKDDDCKMLPELQLLLLLLTGKPANTNMHDYLASKNTERVREGRLGQKKVEELMSAVSMKNLERWETAMLKAVIKLRDTAYQSIAPVCERILIWLEQLRGWAAWNRRFGHLSLQAKIIEECVPIVKLLMLKASNLEALALEEELGFRDFCGWVKFELERISGIEAHSETRPFPKHDVLAVMTYIKTKLVESPLDDLVRVEAEKDSLQYNTGVNEWVYAQVEATKLDNIKKEGANQLADILTRLEMQEKLHVRADLGEQGMQVEDERSSPEDHNEAFQLEQERLFTDAAAYVPPPPPAPVPPTPRRKSAPLPSPQPVAEPFIPTDLPLPFYLSEVAKRLSGLFEHSFHSVAERAVIREVKQVVEWQPADREEDDSMTALGLARDPTKITSRVVKSVLEEGAEIVHHWIACETLPGTVVDGKEREAFWLLRLGENGATYGTALALRTTEDAAFEILDIEFFDDTEVALLLRLPIQGSRQPQHAIATVRYQDIDLVELEGGMINFAQFPSLSPVPFSRFHRFDSSFEPLQFALNGRKGRRVGCVLGNLGSVLEVLDMEVEEAEHEQEEEFADDLEDQSMQIPDFVEDTEVNGTWEVADEGDGVEDEDINL